MWAKWLPIPLAALAALLLAVWIAPGQVAAEPARCNSTAPENATCTPGSPDGQPSSTTGFQPSGFQAPHNSTADTCGVIGGTALAAKGCWEEPFYPGGPNLLGASGPDWTQDALRSSWLDACLVKAGLPLRSGGANPFARVADQHTKIACCTSHACVKAPSGVSDPAACGTVLPGSSAFACPYPAVLNAMLKDGRFLHVTGIDGIEDQTPAGFVAEAEEIDSPWRVLDLSRGAPGTLTIPTLTDLISGTTIADDTGGGGDRFCGNLTFLPSGRVVFAGGTRWTDDHAGIPTDPSIQPGSFALELEGLKTTTVYDTELNTAFTAGAMADGRWYPGMLSLGSGNVLGGGGIGVLRLQSTHRDTWGVFSSKTHTWTAFPNTDTSNPCTGDPPAGTGNVGTSPCRTLPLFPRLQLLPNGEVFYPAVGQLWGGWGVPRVGPPTWHKTVIANPEPATGIPNPGLWRDTGDASPATRNGAVVLLRPLEPPYTTATAVAMGGVPWPPTPGAGFGGITPQPLSGGSALPHDAIAISGPTLLTPVSTTEVMALSAPAGSSATVLSRTMSPVSHPDMAIARWFAMAVILPDRSVINIGGATADGAAQPGIDCPIHEMERSRDGGLSDPWKLTATAHRPRTYHNTAGLLMPDGRVASAGHRPIPAGFVGNPIEDSERHAPTCVPNVKGFQFGRDLMWEIYEPGYFFEGNGTRAARPELRSPSKDKFRYGEAVCLKVKPVSSIGNVSAQLIRPEAVTHIDQHEQRLVVLDTLGTCDGGHGILVVMPPNGHVAPPGFWMLSVLEFNANPTNPDWSDVPSEARFVQLCRSKFGEKCDGP